MTTTIPTQLGPLAPAELRGTINELSKAIGAQADQIADHSADTQRDMLRRLDDRGVRSDIAERDARRVKLGMLDAARGDRKSTRLNSSHVKISYAVFCLKKKKKK